MKDQMNLKILNCCFILHSLSLFVCTSPEKQEVFVSNVGRKSIWVCILIFGINNNKVHLKNEQVSNYLKRHSSTSRGRGEGGKQPQSYAFLIMFSFELKNLPVLK